MHCAAHPDRGSIGSCATCSKELCEACATYSMAGDLGCDRCGRQREAEAAELSSGVLAFVGVGYLATLALGILLFGPKPFVGGLAAIVALGLGRALQLLVQSPAVTRRAVP